MPSLKEVANAIKSIYNAGERVASFGKMSLLNNSKDKKPLKSENLYFHKAEI